MGLGVSQDILNACGPSYKIYNSIDAPALRIPPEVSQCFDLILTGAEWQSQEVRQRHPQMATAVLPIGPEFASETQFHPIVGPKPYDIVYVAAAQAYKRHDILFDALEKLPRSIRSLCVFGYGELGDDLRQRALDLGIDVDFIGPPGVPFAEVNQLMNLAKIGVVCGIDDGAPPSSLNICWPVFLFSPTVGCAADCNTSLPRRDGPHRQKAFTKRFC